MTPPTPHVDFKNSYTQMNVALLRESCKKAEVVQKGGEPLNEVAVQFSNDAKWMFVCCGKCVGVYSRGSHQLVRSLPHASKVVAARPNPNNHMQLMTTTVEGELTLWDFNDGALLKTVEFKVPLHKFAIRPGKIEPSIFFVVEKEKMSVVGVSSHVITNPTTPPSEQLLDSHPLVTTDTAPRDFTFTYQGAHLVTSTGNGKRLIIYDFENEREYKYKCRYGVTALACHPSQLCIATGNGRGEIKLWYDFALPGTNEIVTCLHWHAHRVADLCFTTDGTYLLSGGEEGVLVLWQHRTGHRQFRPRLGAAITTVSCSPGDAYFTVSLQNNVVELVSGLNSDVEGILGGLRRALVTEAGENPVKTGLVLRPLSSSLVLNSSPGLLQFYDTGTGDLSEQLDVVGLNYVSRTEEKPLVPTTVDHVAFTPTGDWMATVESRDDGITSAELRMKFWKFVTAQQKYMLTTCVDPPHDKMVSSLSFQPMESTAPLTPPSGGMATSCDSTHVPLAVTTSLDQRFKVWVLVDQDEGEEEGEEGQERKGGRGRKKMPSWACRSVSYYHRLPCLGACFSQDGSLLAVNFSKNVTIWDPYSCALRQTFSTPHSDEAFKQVLFGQHSCSQYLLASATEHIHVWDLLSCKLLWKVAVTASYLAVDPFTHLAAAFVQTDKQDTALVYLLEPSSPTPLSVHTLPSSEPVMGAAFVPHTWDPKKLYKVPVGERSTLYFINTQQVLYSLEREEECLKDSEERVAGPRKRSADTRGGGPVQKLQTGQESDSHKTFLEIFGRRKRPNGLYTSSAASTTTTPRLPPSMQLLQAPPHVLPPPTSLCGPFMRRLLPLPLEHDHSRPEGNGETPNEKLGEEELEVEDTKKSCIVSSQVTSDRNTDKRNYKDLKTSSYEWLTEYFQPPRKSTT